MGNHFLAWNSVLKEFADEVNSKPEAEHLRFDPGKHVTGRFGSGEVAWKGRWSGAIPLAANYQKRVHCRRLADHAALLNENGHGYDITTTEREQGSESVETGNKEGAGR